MTTRKYSSRSQQTTLTSAITSTATTATVGSGTTLLGGITISAGETFTVVIDPDTALEEIVDVTAVSTNTLTIVRGVETAGVGQAHSAGAVVRHMVTGRDLREANQHIENTTTAHGLTLANVVKTTDTGTVSSGMIATGAVGTAKIDDTAVTEAKIGTSAVTAGKIATDAVTTAKIQDSAVTSAKIADGTIVNADINAAAAITKTKISGTAITGADVGTVNSTILADLAVTTAKLVDSNVTTAKIADLNVTTGKIADSAITSAKIADATIVNADISTTAAIALSKLATDPLARANHTGTQTAATISNFDTQVQTSRLDQMAAPTSSVSLNSQKITNLGTPTLSTDASTKAYVDSQITSLVGGAPGTLDTLNEIAAAINNSGSFATSVVLRDGTQAMTGNLAMGTNKITGLGTPTAGTDAVTKAYADAILVGAPGNLTGPITSVGAATSIASQTGTGTTFVMNTSPTIITPVITASSTTDALRITNTGTGNSLLVEDSANPDSTPFVIDLNGRLILGHTSYPTAGSGAFLGNIIGTGSGYPLALYGMYASSTGSRIAFHKSRSTAIGTYTTINSGDTLGDLVFYGDDGTAWQNSATIRANADAAPSGGVIPGRLVFLTTDSAGTSAERMRIDSAGNVAIGSATAVGQSFRNSKNITGAVTAYGIVNNGQVQSDVTTSAIGFISNLSTQNANFTLPSMYHFYVNPGTFNNVTAGGAVTNQYGFFIENNFTGATNNYGFYSNIASGTGDWNFYAGGTAANYFAGRVGIGATLTSGAMAQVTNTTAADVGFIVKGAASQTGDLQQWQNSAGTVLVEVTASGGLELNGKDIELMTLMGAL